MSPDSVPRFWTPAQSPSTWWVFDEASQIRVPEAIGAMGRARAVVVVGDEKQMPPTSIAQVGVGTGSDLDPDTVEGQLALAVEDKESILSECAKVQVPTISLTWHYRGPDEELIAFSNHAYYKDRLAMFPAPVAADNSSTGLRLVRVPDGQFIRVNDGRHYRTNPVEAAAIISEITRRLHDPVDSRWTMGVVTFNAQQQELIERLLDECDDPLVQEALQEPDPERRLFVKNLESVQCDERDVIMFSIAFSKNGRGVVPLTWGPMTRAGGERRLNVAVTRGKRQVLVFCSFEPHELNVEGSSSIAMRHVKEYLELAAHGTLPSTVGRSRGAEARDYHREDLAAALREHGLDVTENLGLSTFRIDLAVRVPGVVDTPVLAVLLDGPRWRSRSTVRDRDALPVDVLAKAMGWPAVARVWLPTCSTTGRTSSITWSPSPTRPPTRCVTGRQSMFPWPRCRRWSRSNRLSRRNRLRPRSPRSRFSTGRRSRTFRRPGSRRRSLPRPSSSANSSTEAAATADPGGLGWPRRPSIAPVAPVPAPSTPTTAPAGLTFAPYREWAARPVTPVEQACSSDVLGALVEIVTAEGPMHAEWAYRRYIKASGKEQLGSNLKTTFNRLMYEAVRRGRLLQIKDDVVGQLGRTVHAPGTDAVVVRELGPRALEDVPRSEVRAVAESLGLGEKSRVDVKRAVLGAYGRSNLTKTADKYLDEAFDSAAVTM